MNGYDPMFDWEYTYLLEVGVYPWEDEEEDQ